MAFKDFVKTVKSETGDAIEVTKLKAKISKEKSDIKDNYEKIGEFIYNRYKSCGEADDGIMSLISEIDAAKGRIDGYNQEIARVKMD